MKKSLLLLTFILLFGSIFAQFECGTVETSLKSSRFLPNSSDYIPDSNTPMKTLRVNVHFILKEGSEPGNFTQYDDGRGNTNFSGYKFADSLINRANDRLATNTKMNLPPYNSTAVLPRKYKYILNAVFFHRSNSYYLYTQNPTNMNAAFGENIGECINVYFQGKDNGFGSGACADMEGNRSVTFNGAWDDFLVYNKDAMWVKAGTLNHEIGHNLSLCHTIIPKKSDGTGSTCNGEDYCSDTPIATDFTAIHPCDDCARWGTSANCPNNQMGYSGSSAITPEQLGRVHWTIENEMSNYKSCFAPYLNISLTSFNATISYICTTLTIPTGSSISVNSNKSLYISTENFIANGALNVAVGSTLVIKPLSSNCN